MGLSYVVHVSDLHDNNDTLEAAVAKANELKEKGEQVMMLNGGDNTDEETLQSFQVAQQVYNSLFRKALQEAGITTEEELQKQYSAVEQRVVEMAQPHTGELEGLLNQYKEEVAGRLEIQNKIFRKFSGKKFSIRGNHEFDDEFDGEGEYSSPYKLEEALNELEFLEPGKVVKHNGLYFTGMVNCYERLSVLHFLGQVLGRDLQRHLENDRSYSIHDPVEAQKLEDYLSGGGRLDFGLVHKDYGPGASTDKRGNPYGFGEKTWAVLQGKDIDRYGGHIHSVHEMSHVGSGEVPVLQDEAGIALRSDPNSFNVGIYDDRTGERKGYDSFTVMGEYDGELYEKYEFNKRFHSSEKKLIN